MAITKRKINSLKIIYWNANGLLAKLQELKEYIIRENFDLVLIGETHLIPSKTIKIPNYIFYRNDRTGRPGGGTGIFIKSSIPHRNTPTPHLNIMEATIVEVDFQTIGTTRIISAYYPPAKTFVENDYKSLLHTNKPTLLTGDLNSKHVSWSSNYNNTYGNELIKICNSHGLLVYAPTRPTIFSPIGRPDIIDIALNKDISLPIEITSEDELSSDHNPIKIQIGNPEIVEETEEIKKIDWNIFKEYFNNFGNIKTIDNTDDLETAVNHLTENIQSALTNATTLITRKTQNYFDIPKRVKDIIKEKRRARKIANITNNPEDKRKANQLNNQVKVELEHIRNENWSQKIESLNHDTQSYWKMTKILTKKKFQTKIPPLNYNGKAAITNIEKAEVFAESLQNQFTINKPNPENQKLFDKINSYVLSFKKHCNNNRKPLDPTSPEEINDIIKKLSVKKAPGPDHITNKALKELPNKIKVAIASYSNAILRLNSFPSAFKSADIIMIPKQGKTLSDPTNHRPISLLSSLGKVIEAVILTKIKNECDKLDIIPNFQFGFRPNHSTEHQVHRLVEYITEGFSEGESTGAIFLDISKAFDKIWYNGLVYKLCIKGFNTNLITLI